MLRFGDFKLRLCGDCLNVLGDYEGADASRLKRVYGIGPENHGRLFAMQRGRCAICESETRALVVDHNHKTGAVRGLLCGQCNLAIGLLQDSPLALSKAITYLMDSPASRDEADLERKIHHPR